MKHELPKLDYEYDALEPFIDKETMEIHHTKHHQAYVDKLNAALEKYPELQEKPVEELLADLDSVPEEIRQAVINHGGGHANHSLFWKQLKKDSNKPSEKLLKAFEEELGADYHDKWMDMAMKHFGSGWIWVCVDKDKKLVMLTTKNQDSPVSLGLKPIMAVDLWEHAYYLKYQNRRKDYLEALSKLTNWEYVSQLYEEAIQ